MKHNPLDILTVSDMCVDLVVSGNVRPQFHQVEQIVGDCSLELGGSANIFAAQFAKLGGRAGVVGYVGQDAFGEICLRELQKATVDTERIKTHPRLKTGIGVALTEENDRAILTYMGTIDATQPADMDESLLNSCRHWHLASPFLLRSLRSCWPAWLKKCRELGLTTSLDTNWDPENEWKGIIDLLALVDVFLPNEQEALAITGEKDIRKAVRVLAAHGPLTVVKCGGEGVIAMKGDQTWEFKVSDYHHAPVQVADSTGAGDNFDAGFLRGWMLGYDNDFSLRLGHRCAVSSLAYQGGIRGQLVEVIPPNQSNP